MTSGFSDVHFTVLFPFTLAGRKLGPVFIFHAERGKRVEKEAIGSWQEELLPPPTPGQPTQRAYFFCNKAGFMDATIYAEVIWSLHRELMDARGENPNQYPRTHLLHDRASAHIEQHMKEVFESVNMGTTLVDLTGKLQIFDVGCGRTVRAGYLAEHTLHFHSHDLKEGDLTFRRLSGKSKKGKPHYMGPYRVLKIEVVQEDGTQQSTQMVTLGLGGSNSVVPLENTRRNVISKPAYRKLAVIFVCNVWYNHVEEKLIEKIAVKTGSMAKWDGSQDDQVRVFIGQYQVPFGPVREKVFLEAKKESTCAGSPSSFSRPADEKRFIKAKEMIAAAAAVRRRDKAEKGVLVSGESVRGKRKREKAVQPSSPSSPIAKRRRGRPRNNSMATNEESDMKIATKESPAPDEPDEELTGDNIDEDSDDSEEDWTVFLTDQQVADYQRKKKVDLTSLLVKGEMVVVVGRPECGDTQAFYVGAVLEPHTITTDSSNSDQLFTLQFYNNFKQDLYGAYQPAWLDPNCHPPKEDHGRPKTGPGVLG